MSVLASPTNVVLALMRLHEEIIAARHTLPLVIDKTLIQSVLMEPHAVHEAFYTACIHIDVGRPPGAVS